jgi:hypothetical protein
VDIPNNGIFVFASNGNFKINLATKAKKAQALFEKLTALGSIKKYCFKEGDR